MLFITALNRTIQELKSDKGCHTISSGPSLNRTIQELK